MEQYVKYPPMTERQIEMMQEQLFHKYGPFYHLSTKPLENGVIFECEEERKVAINLIAILAEETHVDILAFAIMSNHLHFIIQGELVDGIEFFRRLKKRLSNYLARRGRAGVMDLVDVDHDTPAITNLTQFRNEIAYVIRNPYVARTDVNPFAYPWCSGYLYFNPLLDNLCSKSIDELSYKEKREITRATDPVLNPKFRVRDGLRPLKRMGRGLVGPRSFSVDISSQMARCINGSLAPNENMFRTGSQLGTGSSARSNLWRQAAEICNYSGIGWGLSPVGRESGTMGDGSLAPLGMGVWHQMRIWLGVVPAIP